MNYMFLIPALVLLAAATLLLYRAFVGPTIFDRILAVNAAGTKTVVLVALLGFFGDPAYYLDTALVYALINFVATVAVLKFVEHRRLG